MISLLIPTVHSCPHSLSFFLSPLLVFQITFLEFFEVLLGSAEVKCQQVSPSSAETKARSDLPEVELFRILRYTLLCCFISDLFFKYYAMTFFVHT